MVADKTRKERYYTVIDRNYILGKESVDVKVGVVSSLANAQDLNMKAYLVTAEVHSGSTLLAAMKHLKQHGYSYKAFAFIKSHSCNVLDIDYLIESDSRELLPWHQTPHRDS